jgi:hypothetical protein
MDALRSTAPDSPLLVWNDAHAMVREIGPHLPQTRLISLDHDLEPIEGASDPGDGLQVVRFLVSQPIIRPVVIHTSNFERSRLMACEFQQAGWPSLRVAPLGDDWIESDWSRAVKKLLKRSADNQFPS